MELKLKAILAEDAKKALVSKRVPAFGKYSRETTEYCIGLTRVTINQGVVYSEVPSFGEISGEIAPYVVGYTIETSIDVRIVGNRELGKYTLPNCKETICSITPYIGVVHTAIFHGKDRDKVVQLFELIRDDKIEPTEQIGGDKDRKSRKQLESELTATSEELGRKILELAGVRRQLEQVSGSRDEYIRRDKHMAQKIGAVTMLARGLADWRFNPFYTKDGVSKRILEIVLALAPPEEQKK